MNACASPPSTKITEAYFNRPRLDGKAKTARFFAFFRANVANDEGQVSDLLAIWITIIAEFAWWVGRALIEFAQALHFDHGARKQYTDAIRPMTLASNAIPSHAAPVDAACRGWSGIFADWIFAHRKILWALVLLSYLAAYNGQWQMTPDSALYLALGRN